MHHWTIHSALKDLVPPVEICGHQLEGNDNILVKPVFCVFPIKEAKAESKDNDSDSEEQSKGPDAGPAFASQPQRITLFPGMDPSALKVNQCLCSD